MVDRFRLVSVGVAISLLFVLPAGVGPDDSEPDAAQLVKKAVESLEDAPVRAVHEQTITRPDGVVTQTVAVHRTSTESGYIRVLQPPGDGTGNRVVFNGSFEGRQAANDYQVRNGGDTQFWFDKLRKPGASPEAVLTQYQSKYAGIEKIGSRSAYVVELVPPKETTAELSLDIDAGDIEYHVPLHEATHREWYLSRETWWIDTETHYPIKQTVEWTDEDGTVLATAKINYKKLTLGSATENTRPILNRTTEDTRPILNTENTRPVLNTTDNVGGDTDTGGTTTESTTDPKPTNQESEPSQLFNTPQAASDAVPFELPALDVPGQYSFDRATVTSQGDSHAVLLVYTDTQSGSQLSVQVSQNESSLFYHNMVIQRKDLPQFDGELVLTDTGTEVVRQCDSLTYRLRGPPDAQTLIGVAESTDC